MCNKSTKQIEHHHKHEICLESTEELGCYFLPFKQMNVPVSMIMILPPHLETIFLKKIIDTLLYHQSKNLHGNQVYDPLSSFLCQSDQVPNRLACILFLRPLLPIHDTTTDHQIHKAFFLLGLHLRMYMSANSNLCLIAKQHTRRKAWIRIWRMRWWLFTMLKFCQ